MAFACACRDTPALLAVTEDPCQAGHFKTLAAWQIARAPNVQRPKMRQTILQGSEHEGDGSDGRESPGASNAQRLHQSNARPARDKPNDGYLVSQEF